MASLPRAYLIAPVRCRLAGSPLGDARRASTKGIPESAATCCQECDRASSTASAKGAFRRRDDDCNWLFAITAGTSHDQIAAPRRGTGLRAQIRSRLSRPSYAVRFLL